MNGDLRTWILPAAEDVGEDVETFLRRLGGPTCIELRGERRDELRILTTLLHGNEPSGTHAVHRYLRAGLRPLTDLWMIVVGVETALAAPTFGHRALPDRRDLNRCFRAPFDGPEGRLARTVLDRIAKARPRALVDLHNTSGRGPAYSVCTRTDPERLALTSLFAPRLVHTDLVLGTIVEAADVITPSCTIECGGAADARSHDVAFRGLCRFASVGDVFAHDAPAPDVLAHPIRVELAPDTRIGYGDADPAAHDLVLDRELDLHNFGAIEIGATLGRLGPRGLSILHARDGRGTVPTEHLFANEAGRLVASRRFSPLMVTTDAAIARSDCLLYVVPLG